MQPAHMTLSRWTGTGQQRPLLRGPSGVSSCPGGIIASAKKGAKGPDATPEPAGEGTHDPEMVVQGRWTTQRSPTHECLTLKSTDSVQRCIEKARAAGSSRDPFAHSAVRPNTSPHHPE